MAFFVKRRNALKGEELGKLFMKDVVGCYLQ